MGFFKLFVGDFTSKGSKLALLLILATLPVVVCGLILKLTGYNEIIRSIRTIGWAMLVFGILLYLVDQNSEQTRNKGDWGFRDAYKLGPMANNCFNTGCITIRNDNYWSKASWF